MELGLSESPYIWLNNLYFTLNLYFLVWVLDSLLIRRTMAFGSCSLNTGSDYTNVLSPVLRTSDTLSMEECIVHKGQLALFCLFFVNFTSSTDTEGRGFTSSIYLQLTFLECFQLLYLSQNGGDMWLLDIILMVEILMMFYYFQYVYFSLNYFRFS